MPDVKNKASVGFGGSLIKRISLYLISALFLALVGSNLYLAYYNHYIFGSHLDNLRKTVNSVNSASQEIPEATKKVITAIYQPDFYSAPFMSTELKRYLGATFNILSGKQPQSRDLRNDFLILTTSARNLMLSEEVGYRPFKFQFHWFMWSYCVDRNFSRDEVINYFCNSMCFGGKVSGLGNGAREYLGRELSEITIDECIKLIAAAHIGFELDNAGNMALLQRVQ